MTPDKVEENIKSALVPWLESFGTKETFDKVITAIDSLHRRVAELESLSYPVVVDINSEGKISTQHHHDLVAEFARRSDPVEMHVHKDTWWVDEGMDAQLDHDAIVAWFTQVLTRHDQDMMIEAVEAERKEWLSGNRCSLCGGNNLNSKGLSDVCGKCFEEQ